MGWRVRVTYPDGTGERRNGTARNMTAAKQAVRQAQTDADAGIRPIAKTLTILQMVTKYMEAKKAIWSYRSLKNNEYLLEKYVKDRLGPLRAAGVTPRAIREYPGGLSVRSSGQNQVRSLLSGVYKRARSAPRHL